MGVANGGVICGAGCREEGKGGESTVSCCRDMGIIFQYSVCLWIGKGEEFPGRKEWLFWHIYMGLIGL